MTPDLFAFTVDVAIDRSKIAALGGIVAIAPGAIVVGNARITPLPIRERFPVGTPVGDALARGDAMVAERRAKQ